MEKNNFKHYKDEIKNFVNENYYRIWIDEEEIFYQPEEGDYIKLFGNGYWTLNDSNDAEITNQKKATLSLSTNMKDFNDEIIYHGDIISPGISNLYCVVINLGGKWAVEYVNQKGEPVCLPLDNADKYKKRGNVFEGVVK
jgi:hypothetical protein